MHWTTAEYTEQTLSNHHLSEEFIWFDCIWGRGQFSYCLVTRKVSASGYRYEYEMSSFPALTPLIYQINLTKKKMTDSFNNDVIVVYTLCDV